MSIAPQSTLGSITSWLLTQVRNEDSETSKVIDAVAPIFRALASPASVIVTGLFHYYVLFDPVTSLIGIGCALLINTVVLNLLDYVIRKFWANHWTSTHPIAAVNPALPPNEISPEVKTIADELLPDLPRDETLRGELIPDLTPGESRLQRLERTEREFLDAKEKYKTLLKELNAATEELKIARDKRDSLNQGKNKDFKDLSNDVERLGKDLIEASKLTQEFIATLHEHSSFIKNEEIEHKIRECRDTITKTTAAENDLVERAKIILDLAIEDIISALSRIFDDMKDTFNKVPKAGTTGLNVDSQDDQKKSAQQMKVIIGLLNSAIEAEDKTLMERRKDYEEFKAEEKSFQDLILLEEKKLEAISLEKTAEDPSPSTASELEKKVSGK